MDALKELIEKLQRPHTLSCYAGLDDFARGLLEEREEILAALQSLAPAGWRDIASAPKDGTAVLGWDGETMTTVEWYELGGYWSLLAVGAWAEDSEWVPTHWMPLPAPPQPRTDAEGETK